MLFSSSRTDPRGGVDWGGHCIIFWDVPGDDLAAPESALGLHRCDLSWSLSPAAVLPGLKLGHPSILLSISLLWTTLICGSHYLICQAGWNRCKLILFYSIAFSYCNHLSVCECLQCSVLDNKCYLLGFCGFWCYMRITLLLESARGCPGSTCISAEWLESGILPLLGRGCHSLSSLSGRRSGVPRHQRLCVHNGSQDVGVSGTWYTIA